MSLPVPNLDDRSWKQIVDEAVRLIPRYCPEWTNHNASDPGVTLDACGRHEVASGKLDSRVLATLAFLSRSGLRPTVSALRCSHGPSATSSSLSAQNAADAADISAINGVAISHGVPCGSICGTIAAHMPPSASAPSPPITISPT